MTKNQNEQQETEFEEIGLWSEDVLKVKAVEKCR